MDGGIHIRLCPLHIVAKLDLFCQTEHFAGGLQRAVEDFRARDFLLASIADQDAVILYDDGIDALSVLHLQQDLVVDPDVFVLIEEGFRLLV